MKFTQIERIAAFECLRLTVENYRANVQEFIEDDARLMKHRFFLSCTELFWLRWLPDKVGDAKIKLSVSQIIDLYIAVQAQGNMTQTEQLREFSRSLSFKLFTKIINNENE